MGLPVTMVRLGCCILLVLAIGSYSMAGRQEKLVSDSCSRIRDASYGPPVDLAALTHNRAAYPNCFKWL